MAATGYTGFAGRRIRCQRPVPAAVAWLSVELINPRRDMRAEDSGRSATASVRRPVGVWVATIWAGLFAGLFPLGLVLFFYFGPAKGSEIMSGLQLLMSVVLGVGIITSAVGTWRGCPWARYALVVLIAIHYALLTYQNYQMASAGIAVRGSTAIPWVRAIRSVITATIIVGYLLLSGRAKEFIQQRDRAAEPDAPHEPPPRVAAGESDGWAA